VTVLDRSNVSPNDRARAVGLPRADFLKILAVAAGSVAAGRILVDGRPDVASAAGRSPSQDRDIFNFLLQLESMQAEFYKDAVAKGALSGDLARFATVAAGHEQAHVKFLRRKLGSGAGQTPSFDFGDTTSDAAKFAATAIKLEDLALGSFVGQGANLTRDQALHAARIASVEGRHAAWVRDIQHRAPAPYAADRAMDQREVTSAMRSLGFSQ
jgi:Ferritin-like domain